MSRGSGRRRDDGPERRRREDRPETRRRKERPERRRPDQALRRPRRAEGPIFARPEPGSRRPAYTREQIARTAIAIADAEGFEAVSMRRIAAELGAGTMTLYHYVRGKDELIALISDAIMGELLVPDDELPDGWREGLAEIARRTFQIFNRHPWIVEHMGEGDPSATGPSVLRHVEQTFAVTARTGLDADDQIELSSIVDDYVFGHGMRAYHGARFGAEGKRGKDLDSLLSYLGEQLATGDYPHLERIMGDDPAAAFERIGHVMSDEDRFERGLDRLLDGLELWVERARRRDYV
jgi:AcrR family transcriptional regulator